jgi:hypothetical protein
MIIFHGPLNHVRFVLFSIKMLAHVQVFLLKSTKMPSSKYILSSEIQI